MPPKFIKLPPTMGAEIAESIDRICVKGQPLSFDILRTMSGQRCGLFEKSDCREDENIKVEFEFDENGTPYFSEATLKQLGG